MIERHPNLSFLLTSSMVMHQEQSLRQRLEAWQKHPLEQLPEGQIITDVRVVKSGIQGLDLTDPWKRIRRDILTMPPGEPLFIGVEGLSGVGKSRIIQGLLQLLKGDIYMHNEAINTPVADSDEKAIDGNQTQEGFYIVPIVVPFSLSAKAAQLSRKYGGLGIRADAGHGSFSDAEYSEISGFQTELVKGGSRLKHPHVRKVFLIEATGLPWFDLRDGKVEITGMADRGNSTVYNLASDPDKKGRYIFLVNRDPALAAQTVLTRQEFSLQGDNIGRIFNDVMRRYLLTEVGLGKNGKADTIRIEDVANLPPRVQKAVVELLLLSTAPPEAIARSNREYRDMKYALVDTKRIRSSDDLSYIRALRRKLVNWGEGFGLPGDQVFIVSNTERKSGRDEHDLDYWTRWNLVAQAFKEQLIPKSLWRYMEVPSDDIIAAGHALPPAN